MSNNVRASGSESCSSSNQDDSPTNNNNNAINNTNNNKRLRQNRADLDALKRARRSLPCRSGQHDSASSSSNHSRCLYVIGAFKSGNNELLNCFRNHYGRQCNTTGLESTPTPASTVATNKSVLYNHPTCIPPMIPYDDLPVNKEPIMSLANNEKFNRANCKECKNKDPDTLLELASKAVAANVPFETVEQHSNRIPIPIQERIIFWSFPREESFLQLYSSISSILIRNKFSASVEAEMRTGGPISSSTSGDHHPLPMSSSFSLPMRDSWRHSSRIFPYVPNRPPRMERWMDVPSLSQDNRSELDKHHFRSLFIAGDILLSRGSVKNVIQIGFTLSGIVSDVINDKVYYYDGSMNQRDILSVIANHPPHFSQGPSPFLPRNTGIDYSLKNSGNSSENEHSVSITFEKCKITQVHCTCNAKRTLVWCEHVVALALYRIRKPYDMELRLPISESIEDLDRDQLKKLLLYVISEHHVQILPTVQKLVDEIQNKQAPINQIDGAPDPTAGSCALSESYWFFNESQLRSQINSLVKNLGWPESSKLMLVFQHFARMLQIQDSNAQRFLKTITFEFTSAYHLGTEFSKLNFDPFAFLWDHLVNLWVFIVCDSRLSETRRKELRQFFRLCNSHQTCSSEFNYFRLEIPNGRSGEPQQNNAEYVNYVNYNGTLSVPAVPSHPDRPPKIFNRVIDASFLQWNDETLEFILHNDFFDPMKHAKLSESVRQNIVNNCPLWNEHLPTAAARIGTLRANGMKAEALRLAVAVVRHLIHTQNEHSSQPIYANSSNSWIGNPLDPIGIIFDTLAEASLRSPCKNFNENYGFIGYDRKIDQAIVIDVLMKQIGNELVENGHYQFSTPPLSDRKNVLPPKYHHVMIPGSATLTDTYLNMAARVAIIGLSQYRQSPDLDAQRDAFYRQEVRLYVKLLDMNWRSDSFLLDVIKEQAEALIRNGLLSDYVDPSTKSYFPNDIVQIPALVNFMFCILTSSRANSTELAYTLGLRSMRHFSLKNHQSSPGHLFTYYMDLQMLLVKCMIFHARNDFARLAAILNALKIHLKLPSFLHQLSIDLYVISLMKTRHLDVLQVAFEIGLHVCVTTYDETSKDNNRAGPISYLIKYATELGFDKLFRLVENWRKYFTPFEAVNNIGAALYHKGYVPPASCTGPKDPVFESLLTAVRSMAVECARENPGQSAFPAMTLCVRDPGRCSEIIAIIEAAAAENRIDSTQLFLIGHHMETYLFPGNGQDLISGSAADPFKSEACKIIMLAAKSVQIDISVATTHPMGPDVLWACDMILALRKDLLPDFLDIVMQNIRCATLLSEVLRRCMAQSFKDSIQYNMNPTMEIQPSYNGDPMSTFMNRTVKIFIDNIRHRLDHISPRHYCDFITYLGKAKEIITLKPSGKKEFEELIVKIKQDYKGKKKLIQLVKERFPGFGNL